MITRLIYPLWLREKISYRINKFFPNASNKDVPLEFGGNIKMDLVSTDFGHNSIIFNGFYELDLSLKMIKLGKKGGLMVDVGANYGYFSCLWADQNANNKVIAFEASPKNIGPLTNNVNKNNLGNRIQIVPKAAGREKGTLQFTLGGNAEQTGWGGLTLNEEPANVVVEVEKLDNYLENINIQQVEVLKIDTEGADTWVLYGAERMLQEKKINHIFFEHNLPRMQALNISPDEAPEFLKKLGYKVQEIAPNEFYATHLQP
jgi:FkbM family methyltransferase